MSFVSSLIANYRLDGALSLHALRMRYRSGGSAPKSPHFLEIVKKPIPGWKPD
jgi:hypothetical protein